MDSVDKIEDETAHTLWWLPFSFPSSVRIFVSCVGRKDDIQPKEGKEPSPLSQIVSKINSLQPPNETVSNVVFVAPFTEEEAPQVLALHLRTHNRTLTPPQQEKILSTFKDPTKGNFNPLFLSTSALLASKWKSWMNIGDCLFGTTVRDCISLHFEKVERIHGATLVRRMLAFMMSSRRGLSEKELLSGLLSFQHLYSFSCFLVSCFFYFLFLVSYFLFLIPCFLFFFFLSSFAKKT